MDFLCTKQLKIVTNSCKFESFLDSNSKNQSNFIITNTIFGVPKTILNILLLNQKKSAPALLGTL